jgi:hypothetical protein
MKEKRRIPRVLRPKNEDKLGTTEERVLADDETTITISLAEYNRLRKEQQLTQGQLTREQLGSYLPSFEFLSDKSDSFKSGTEVTAHQLSLNPHWKHLIEHLKQEQVNKLLFSEPMMSLEFIRGSINGIYLVEELVNMMAASRAAKSNNIQEPHSQT